MEALPSPRDVVVLETSNRGERPTQACPCTVCAPGVQLHPSGGAPVPVVEPLPVRFATALQDHFLSEAEGGAKKVEEVSGAPQPRTRTPTQPLFWVCGTPVREVRDGRAAPLQGHCGPAHAEALRQGPGPGPPRCQRAELGTRRAVGNAPWEDASVARPPSLNTPAWRRVGQQANSGRHRLWTARVCLAHLLCA